MNSRFLEMAKRFASIPDESINKSFDDWADKKGAYRLLSHKDFQTDDFFKLHQNQTNKRIANEQVVLSLHDSSYFGFNSKKSIQGLGQIGGEETHGFIGHYALAITLEGIPLGVQSLTAWSRAYELPWDEEQERWEEAMQECKANAPKNVKMIFVADREADKFKLFVKSLRVKRDFVIRSNHDRLIQGTDYYLSWFLQRNKSQFESKIYVQKYKKDIDFIIKFGEVTFNDPEYAGGKHLQRSSIRSVTVKVVQAVSKDKIDNGKHLSWVLYTNLEVNNLENALEIIRIYKMRWHIENYFKVLKGGACKVEKCCLRTFDRLQKYTCLFSIIAWKLYWAKHISEKNPDANLEEAFTPEEVEVLKIKLGAKNLPEKAGQAMKLIAKMGGFNGRKGDGPPGNVSLWRRMIKLHYQVEFLAELRATNYQL